MGEMQYWHCRHNSSWLELPKDLRPLLRRRNGDDDCQLPAFQILYILEVCISGVFIPVDCLSIISKFRFFRLQLFNKMNLKYFLNAGSIQTSWEFSILSQTSSTWCQELFSVSAPAPSPSWRDGENKSEATLPEFSLTLAAVAYPGPAGRGNNCRGTKTAP